MIKESLFDRYKILKTIDSNDTSSVYLVEDSVDKKRYALRKILGTTTTPIYDTIVKEFKEMSRKLIKLDKRPTSPAIIDFFIEDGMSFLLMDYKDEGSLKIINSYPSVGKILNNRYIVIRGIASGGFGIVYMVRDLSLPGKYWALKEMQEQGGIPEVMEKSFRIEAEMLCKLEHPSIPRISDFFIEGNKLYLVIDYVNGETIKKMLSLLDKGDHFSEDRVITWAIAICDVLHYLHTLPTPIVFRDLKPDNIIISDQGDVKLIDFGIARVVETNKKEATKYALLTEGYAPQEQWLGRAEPRSDIYSLGATLFHIISRVHPKKVAPEFPPVEKYNPSVNPLLSKIISKALEPKINDRYQSAPELKNDLLKIHEEKERIKKSKSHFSKGMKYEIAGDYYNANFEYMTACNFDGENYEIIYGLGKTSEKLGLADKAIEYYKKLLKMNIPEELRKEIKSKLNTSDETEENGITFEINEQSGSGTIPLNLNSGTIPIRQEEKLDKKELSKFKSWYLIPVITGMLFLGIIISIALVKVMFFTGQPDYIKLAENEMAHNNYGKASEYYNKALKLDPKNINAYLGLGKINSEKSPDEAIKYYSQAFNIDKNNKDARENLIKLYLSCGDSLIAKKNFKDAIPCLNNALNINNKEINIRKKLNLCYIKTNNYENLITNSKEILKLKPKDLLAKIDMGTGYYNTGKYEAALNSFLEVLKKKPDKGQKQYINPIVSLCYYKLGKKFLSQNLTKSEEYFIQALNYNHENKDAKEELGKYYFNKGEQFYKEEKYDEARIYLNKVKNLNIKNKKADEYLAEIDKIGQPSSGTNYGDLSGNESYYYNNSSSQSSGNSGNTTQGGTTDYTTDMGGNSGSDPAYNE